MSSTYILYAPYYNITENLYGTIYTAQARFTIHLGSNLWDIRAYCVFKRGMLRLVLSTRLKSG